MKWRGNSVKVNPERESGTLLRVLSLYNLAQKRLKRDLDVNITNNRKKDLMHKPQALGHGAQHLEDDKKQLCLESAKL